MTASLEAMLFRRSPADLLLFALFVFGCATMIKGETDEITVVSTPTGAAVSINGQTGLTPFIASVPSNRDAIVQLSKPGYLSYTETLYSNTRWLYLVADCVLYVPIVVIDLIDGAAWGHDPVALACELAPLPGASNMGAVAHRIPRYSGPVTFNHTTEVQ